VIVSLNSLTSLLDADRRTDCRMQERGRATVTGTIWSLHRVIANPDSSVDDVRTAKRLLLRLLETKKGFPHLEVRKAEIREETRLSRSERSRRADELRSSASKRGQTFQSPGEDRS
jgi:hypothetical protein